MREATARLIELGLTDKEASVYLALLELGPTGVQEIADKANVNRSTTYSTIEMLKRRGLISSAHDGKRVAFSAESPTKLTMLVNREKMELEEKHQRLQHTMPYFMGLFNSLADKPRVRFFEGEHGIASARQTLLEADGEYLSFAAIDESLLRISRIHEDDRLRMARQVSGRYLFSLKPGCTRPQADLRRWQVREIPYELSPFTGEINIVGEKVAAFVSKVEPMAFLVENSEMSGLFRALFDAAWAMAKPRE